MHNLSESGKAGCCRRGGDLHDIHSVTRPRVSPLWAGLVARFNQRLEMPVGWLNPLLYGPVAGSGAFRDITSGDNGAYPAAAGWDACTGWGTPVGSKLLEALGG